MRRRRALHRRPRRAVHRCAREPQRRRRRRRALAQRERLRRRAPVHGRQRAPQHRGRGAPGGARHRVVHVGARQEPPTHAARVTRRRHGGQRARAQWRGRGRQAVVLGRRGVLAAQRPMRGRVGRQGGRARICGVVAQRRVAGWRIPQQRHRRLLGHVECTTARRVVVRRPVTEQRRRARRGPRQRQWRRRHRLAVVGLHVADGGRRQPCHAALYRRRPHERQRRYATRVRVRRAAAAHRGAHHAIAHHAIAHGAAWHAHRPARGGFAVIARRADAAAADAGRHGRARTVVRHRRQRWR
mmetsp:Transcript_36500/g.89160  ORF Transcript_36500/g.89160 Transcript_36500/m.89160 type:complete len:299 (-) Transcript_36500:1-897(-)